MKLTIGPTTLQTEFEFEIFKKIGQYITVEGRLNRINEIGVYVSGGLDSASLLCLILTELQRIGRMDIPITCFTVAKSDGPTYHATNVIKKVDEHFGVSLIHVNNIPNDPEPDSTGNMGPSPILFAQAYSSNMVIYMGQNRMAPDDIKPFKQRLIKDYGYSKIGPNFSAPFLFLHKPQILDLLYQLGCGHLIPHTHTCTTMADEACGVCYSCAERKWAFDALGKTDPGTLPILS